MTPRSDMPILKDISRDELLALLYAYDLYIQDANEEDTYQEGWRPVCLNEFYDAEWKDIIENQFDGDEDDAVREYADRAIKEMERLEQRMVMG
jgi:hypothetical protein